MQDLPGKELMQRHVDYLARRARPQRPRAARAPARRRRVVPGPAPGQRRGPRRPVVLVPAGARWDMGVGHLWAPLFVGKPRRATRAGRSRGRSTVVITSQRQSRPNDIVAPRATVRDARCRNRVWSRPSDGLVGRDPAGVSVRRKRSVLKLAPGRRGGACGADVRRGCSELVGTDSGCRSLHPGERRGLQHQPQGCRKACVLIAGGTGVRRHSARYGLPW